MKYYTEVKGNEVDLFYWRTKTYTLCCQIKHSGYISRVWFLHIKEMVALEYTHLNFSQEALITTRLYWLTYQPVVCLSGCLAMLLPTWIYLIFKKILPSVLDEKRASCFILFLFFKHLYWSIIALQWCVSFCFITKWISYTYTYVPISPPSCVSLPPTLPIPPL